MSAPRPEDLPGLWERSLLAWPDGRRDTSTRVRWLQAQSLFVDLRQPESLPDFPHARCLEDLSPADCTALAAQQGFAGTLGLDGRHFEWAHRIDFQPTRPLPDAGSLEWRDGVLVERGRDVDYVEHWHRHDEPARAPCAALRLCDVDVGTDAILVRVGGSFMFACERGAPLPPYGSLQECVAAADTARQARALVDCEFSFGRVTADGFMIDASTLPFRRGSLLNQGFLGDSCTTRHQRPNGTDIDRRWTIAACEGNIAGLHITR